MCFKVNFDNNNVSKITNQKTYRGLSIVYQSFIFVYSLTLLIISIFAWNRFQDLPIPYTDRFTNWRIDPIYDIYLKDTCDSDSEYFFNLPNGQITYTKWQNQNQIFTLCIRRLKDYNFLSKYPIYPKCKNNEQLCGGVYVENKYCAPVGLCPINSILFVSSEQLKTIDSTKYTNQLKINENLYLISSQLAESLPINQIEIYGTIPCLASSFSNYDAIFSQAFCEKDSIYTLLNEIDQISYASANGFTSNTADKVGVYSRSYTQYDIECRQRNLVSWGNRTLKDGNSIYITASILMIASAMNFGIIGFIQSLYYFLQIQYQAPINNGVNGTFLAFKTFIQYFHSIMIVLYFGLWMDIKLFMQISSNMNCSDGQTQSIINNGLNDINTSWLLSLVMFMLFVAFALFECSAFSLCLDYLLKRKIKPQYRKFTLSSVNQSQFTYEKEDNLYMYFKPQFILQEFSNLQGNEAQVQQQQQILNQNAYEEEPSVSLQQSNSQEMSLKQSQKNSLQQPPIQEQSRQSQFQQPNIFLKKQIVDQGPSQFGEIQNYQVVQTINYNSNQIPIQKPSIKFDIDNDEIEDDLKDQQAYKIHK